MDAAVWTSPDALPGPARAMSATWQVRRSATWCRPQGGFIAAGNEGGDAEPRAAVWCSDAAVEGWSRVTVAGGSGAFGMCAVAVGMGRIVAVAAREDAGVTVWLRDEAGQ